MSARSPLICSAVELWYKKMLKIGSLSELTGMDIKIKVAGFQRLYSKWLWLLMAVYKPSFTDARMFICPRKRYLCCIKHCISICKFLKNIFGGQTGDKISHTKRKKNNKTTSQKNVLNCKRHGLSLAIILLCLSSSLGCRVRLCIISETPKAIVLHTKRKKQ